jgi:hypothetical protein
MYTLSVLHVQLSIEALVPYGEVVNSCVVNSDRVVLKAFLESFIFA